MRRNRRTEQRDKKLTNENGGRKEISERHNEREAQRTISQPGGRRPIRTKGTQMGMGYRGHMHREGKSPREE